MKKSRVSDNGVLMDCVIDFIIAALTLTMALTFLSVTKDPPM